MNTTNNAKNAKNATSMLSTPPLLADIKAQGRVKSAQFEGELAALITACFEGSVLRTDQGIFVRLLGGERFMVAVKELPSEEK